MLLWWFVATDLAYLFALGEDEITIFATLDELTENDLSNSIFLDQFCVSRDSCWYRYKKNMFVPVLKVIAECFGYVFSAETERPVTLKLIP